jgi:hypothetical protein
VVFAIVDDVDDHAAGAAVGIDGGGRSVDVDAVVAATVEKRHAFAGAVGGGDNAHDVGFDDGTRDSRPNANFEIAERKGGFDGFLAQQARQLFDQTARRGADT